MSTDNQIDCEVKPDPNSTLLREGLMLSTCLGLYMWDTMRFLSHQPSKTSGGGWLMQDIPRQTEGLPGLIDQHMGDLGITLVLIYLLRVPVEIGAKIYEAISSKKVNPRTKLC